MWTGKCSLIKGVTKQPLLLLSSMLSREKQATPRFLRAAGLIVAFLDNTSQVRIKSHPVKNGGWEVGKGVPTVDRRFKRRRYKRKVHLRVFLDHRQFV